MMKPQYSHRIFFKPFRCNLLRKMCFEYMF